MVFRDVIVIFSAFSIFTFAEENILCSSSYCDDVKCSDLSSKCQTQNSTHNGIFLPSPTTCNCCEYCLENISEGEACSIGDPSNPTHSSICGPGLYCKITAEGRYDGTCARMQTKCHLKQDEYDSRRKNGTLGSLELRQSCDDDGYYSSYKCIPGQTCYCIDQNGNRIFGESDFTGIPEFKMQCGCSRAYAEAQEIIGRELNPSEHFRCTPEGDFDRVQCIGDGCFCVDSSDGAPTYPGDPNVNVTEISNSTLNCYIGEDVGVYYKKCEEEYITILKEVKKYKEEGYDMVLSYTFPNCDLDGTYKAVQENSTHKLCVNTEGEVLTAVDKIEDAKLAESMNCKCIRAISIMSTREKPICQENGNYLPVQCRRSICRCVDQDGNQVCSTSSCEAEESEMDILKCV